MMISKGLTLYESRQGNVNEQLTVSSEQIAVLSIIANVVVLIFND
ncbi:hypothetical protein [Algivirga pacifica]|uniref:Uncharacterized protein n=1 Tax=Algivirga pacifica TaxID=1162670 RepID=A0ABP9D0A6_9BACT